MLLTSLFYRSLTTGSSLPDNLNQCVCFLLHRVLFVGSKQKSQTVLSTSFSAVEVAARGQLMFVMLSQKYAKLRQVIFPSLLTKGHTAQLILSTLVFLFCLRKLILALVQDRDVSILNLQNSNLQLFLQLGKRQSMQTDQLNHWKLRCGQRFRGPEPHLVCL